MTLLYVPRPVTAADLELMVRLESKSEYRNALDLLHRYHIFKDTTTNASRAYSLTPDFARSLRHALVGSGNANSFGRVIHVAASQAVTVADLDEFSKRQWEGILGFMVGTSSADTESHAQTAPPAQGVIELLKAGHLIVLNTSSARGHTPKITKEGFAFVLQDVNTQIWALLFLYVDNAEVFGMDKVDVLSFLFFISSLELGSAYSKTALDDTQQQILRDLISFGIVFLPPRPDGSEAGYFYPTRLATTLTSDSSAAISTTNSTLASSLSASSESAGSSQGFIIVETNYRVYAYTSSPLQIALLSLFINLRSRHPNLVTGKMTKHSVQRAVRAGITAEQMIAYLSSNAHPQMRRHAAAEQAAMQARDKESIKPVSLLPATILDQISLWQLERDRMTTTAGFLLKDFASQAEYEAPCRYAEEIGVRVWKNDKKRMFFVNKIDGVKAFLAERNNRSNQN